MNVWTLEHVLEILQRRRWWIAVAAIAGLALGVVVWKVLPPAYAAWATIMVEPQGVPESYIRSQSNFEQRIDTLRQRVTSHANLNQLIDRIGPERFDPKGRLGREEMMEMIRERLEVEVPDRHRDVAVIELSYWAEDPELVARVVTEIADLYIAENQKDRAQRAEATAEFLDTELIKLREKVAEQEDRIRTFQTEHIGALPTQLEANLRELDRLNASLTASVEAQDGLVRRIDLLRKQGGGGRESPTQLSAALHEARVELTKARAVYTEDHPKVKSLLDQIARLEREIVEGPGDPSPGGATSLSQGPSDPALRLELGEADASLQARRREEEHLRQRIAELEARVDATPKNEQALLALTRDYDNLATTYQRLLANKHDASLARSLEQAQMAERFSLLRPAREPAKPFWPDPLLLVPGGLAFGLALAALAILGAELRHPAFHAPTTLESMGLTVMASIPELVRERIYPESPPEKPDWRLVVYHAPRSAVAEQYRSFLPHFMEAASTSERGRVILVTSAAAGDGKSITCMNVACSLAMDLGLRVLVVDADLRRASLHRIVGVDRKPGLTDVLSREARLEDCVVNPVADLHLLPSGRSVTNPLALLTGESFFEFREEVCESYDAVLIDSPPIVPVIDGRLLRRMADLVVFVVRAGSTPPAPVLRSLRELQGVGGVIFNSVSPSAFHRYYHYDAYSHYGSEEPVVPREPGTGATGGRRFLGRRGKTESRSQDG